MGGRVEAGPGPGGALTVLRRRVVVVMMMVVMGRVGVESLGLVGGHVEGGLLDGVCLSGRLLESVSSHPTQRRREALSRLRKSTDTDHSIMQPTNTKETKRHILTVRPSVSKTK